jgi:transcription antitermination factor NusG
MNNNQRINQRSKEIQDLSQNIKELSARLNALIIEEANDQATEQEDSNKTNRDQARHQEHRHIKDIEIGDQVQILNNYKGLRGQIGVVTHITTFQVSIRIPGRRGLVTKRKNNVRKIEEGATV